MKQTFNLTFKTIKHFRSCLEDSQIMFLEVFQANFKKPTDSVIRKLGSAISSGEGAKSKKPKLFIIKLRPVKWRGLLQILKCLVKRDILQGVLCYLKTWSFPTHTYIPHGSLATVIKIYNDNLNSEKEHIRASVCKKLQTLILQTHFNQTDYSYTSK